MFQRFSNNFVGADNVLATCANDFIAENILRSFKSINRVKGYLFRYPDESNFVDSILENLPEFCRLYDTYVAAPRGPLHAGRSTQGAPWRLLYGFGELQIFFLLTYAQY